jgi:hypothetical protein
MFSNRCVSFFKKKNKIKWGCLHLFKGDYLSFSAWRLTPEDRMEIRFPNPSHASQSHFAKVTWSASTCFQELFLRCFGPGCPWPGGSAPSPSRSPLHTTTRSVDGATIVDISGWPLLVCWIWHPRTSSFSSEGQLSSNYFQISYNLMVKGLKRIDITLICFNFERSIRHAEVMQFQKIGIS